MKKHLVIITSLLTFALLPVAKAENIALWTFETTSNSITGSSSTIGPIAADFGSGSASGFHASSSATWSHPAGNGSPSSFSVNTWAVGDYFQFQVNTLGLSGIGVSYDQTSSGTGPGRFDFSYSTDGVTFSPFASSYTVLANGGAPFPSWNASSGTNAYSFSYDLSGVSALNNASSVYFRIVDASTLSANGGTVATAGTDRIDNFLVTGTAVPEPSVWGIAALGFVNLLFLRRTFSNRR